MKSSNPCCGYNAPAARLRNECARGEPQRSSLGPQCGLFVANYQRGASAGFVAECLGRSDRPPRPRDTSSSSSVAFSIPVPNVSAQALGSRCASLEPGARVEGGSRLHKGVLHCSLWQFAIRHCCVTFARLWCWCRACFLCGNLCASASLRCRNILAASQTYASSMLASAGFGFPQSKTGGDAG